MPWFFDCIEPGDPALAAQARAARRLLHRRALVAAAAGAVPVPGFDWAVDAALIAKLVPDINAEFGLTPEQLDALPVHKRDRLRQAIGLIGSMLIGKFITRDLILRATAALGVRLTAGQAAKVLPIIGLGVSAAIGYATIRSLGEAHIRDCIAVRQLATDLAHTPAA